MAPRRLIDARLFWVESALLDWIAIYGSSQRQPIDVVVPDIDNPDFALRQAALRWNVNAGNHVLGTEDPIGLPTGPFTVWRRRPLPLGDLEQPLTVTPLGGLFLGYRLVNFDRTVATVTLDVTSPSGGLVIGLANAPRPLSLLTWRDVPSGSVTVHLQAGRLNGLLVPPTMTINDARGSDPLEYAEAAEWEPVEIVGMPVDGSWAGVGDHLTEQGLIGSLTDPIDAALGRVLRGTPPFGWRAHVEPGVVAPPWEPPPPGGVVDEVSAVLLPRLLKALSLPQAQQPGHVFTAPIPPPATLSGTAMSGTDTDAAIAPVALLQVAVSGDPFLSLGLGYGTNLPDGKAGNFDDFQQGAEYDYMVTAPYARGVDPGGEPVELASLALRPLRPFPPPIPANMGSKLRAHLAPVVPDADWRASTITRWDRPLDAALVRVASHAVTRHRPGDTAAEALLEKRASRGHHPITPAVDVEDDESNFVHYADRQFAIPANPGHVAVRYSVANQNIFGMWSNWMNSQVDVAQPQLLPPRVLAADLEVGVPATGTACPAALTVDVTWDWTDRRPAELRIVGRLFPAADRSATVANVPPAGLDRQLGVAGTAIVLTFSGDSATMSGAPAGSELLYLDPQGSEEVLPGGATR